MTMKWTAFLLSSLLGAASAADASPTTLSAVVDAKRKTLTYTTTTYIQVNTTVPGIATVTNAVTYNRPYPFVYYTYVYTGTPTTETYTTTETAYTTLKAKSTVSVSSTTAGFTPILKQSYYTDKLVIKTVTGTSTSTFTGSPTATTTLSTFVWGYDGVTSTTVTTQSTVGVIATTTITSTATPATVTKYAACRADNLATKVPTGQILNSVGEDGDTEDTGYHTANAEDCCAICQSTPGCFGGGWGNRPGYDLGYCFVYFTTGDNPSETCNGTNAYGSFGSDPEYYGDGQYDGTYTAFNGPCGSLDWYYPYQGLSTNN